MTREDDLENNPYKLPMGRVKSTVAEVVHLILAIAEFTLVILEFVSGIAIIAMAYSWIAYGDPLYVPTQAVLWVINVAVPFIYGCDGPRVPVLCPQ